MGSSTLSYLVGGVTNQYSTREKLHEVRDQFRTLLPLTIKRSVSTHTDHSSIDGRSLKKEMKYSIKETFNFYIINTTKYFTTLSFKMKGFV